MNAFTFCVHKARRRKILNILKWKNHAVTWFYYISYEFKIVESMRRTLPQSMIASILVPSSARSKWFKMIIGSRLKLWKNATVSCGFLWRQRLTTRRLKINRHHVPDEEMEREKKREERAIHVTYAILDDSLLFQDILMCVCVCLISVPSQYVHSSQHGIFFRRLIKTKNRRTKREKRDKRYWSHKHWLKLKLSIMFWKGFCHDVYCASIWVLSLRLIIFTK